ncbi:GerAB/ArcD/ProY family transporter [Paenibacillus lutrae]|uniref:GerAB/ArcD/ProY family transporter n=1 Tax=Paenibacillus lutrae TaxID=2078573 RepID=A0A7X3K0D0_9BACL|nr:GerAB/ArcD/ProY family transporter [Paenibacillus lutrae]MVP01119.1 GerAB/ArcD/ProY family transporter [Paenibacillus lutrae]
MQNSTVTRMFSFRAYLLFFIVSAAQIGVGGASFQRNLYKILEQDSWIAVLIAGLAAHIVVAAILSFLGKNPGSDLYDLHQDTFGKFAGALCSTVYMIYLMTIALTILRNYIEIIQTWMFPDIPTWFLSLFVLALMLYGILGGLRVIIGVALISVIVITSEIALFYYPIQYANWGYLLPVMEHPLSDMLKGAFSMSFTIVGFELLMFVYPFVSNKAKAAKYSHLAIAFTTLTYLIFTVTTLVYFSGEQLMHTIWPTLTLLKIVEFPLFERVEYITVSLYLIGILPNTMLYVWSAGRGLSKIIRIKERQAPVWIAAALFISSVWFTSHLEIERLNNFSGRFSVLMAFLYPLFICLVVTVKRAFTGPRKRRLT